MPKRSERATRKEAADIAGGTAIADGVGSEIAILVARVGTETVGFNLADVAEIIRLPHLAFMPLAPKSLMGLANLRGLVLPVISLRRLLGFPDGPASDATRVVVISRGVPIGLIVDRIESLAGVSAGQIDHDNAGAGRLNSEVVAGIVRGSKGSSSTVLLNPERLLGAEFNRLGVAAGRAGTTVALSVDASTGAAETQQLISLISFELGNQEYALPLSRVREIIPTPEHISEVAGSGTAVLGIVTVRDRLLPVVSLRALLGLPAGGDGRGKVVVLAMGNNIIGIVADRTREILRVDPAFVDPAPALLTRGEGEAEIESIVRLNDGKRIVAVLSPDRLFRSELVNRVLSEAGNSNPGQDGNTPSSAMADEQFIIFRLGDQEYGVPIVAIEEIVRPPEQITKLPKAPAFVDGVINLRGNVVPIVDLRRRFDLGSAEQGSARRILILSIGGGQTGFMVDAVSEVLKIPVDVIRPAPELSSEQTRLIDRVANIAAADRLILLVDPAQLLDQIETDMLAKFKRTRSKQESKAS